MIAHTSISSSITGIASDFSSQFPFSFLVKLDMLKCTLNSLLFLFGQKFSFPTASIQALQIEDFDRGNLYVTKTSNNLLLSRSFQRIIIPMNVNAEFYEVHRLFLHPTNAHVLTIFKGEKIRN